MALIVALVRVDGEADARHAELAARLREATPAVRWVASYRVDGPYDFVDVLEVDPADAAEAERILRDLDGCHAEWLPAEASALLRAPGGPPGGAPGGGPGGPPGGAPG